MRDFKEMRYNYIANEPHREKHPKFVEPNGTGMNMRKQ